MTIDTTDLDDLYAMLKKMDEPYGYLYMKKFYKRLSDINEDDFLLACVSNAIVTLYK